MTDGELLEFAAKAAGIEGEWGGIIKNGEDEIDCSDMFFIEDSEHGAIWDPLADDGDALRLAVKLELCLDSGLISVYRAARNVNDAIYEIGTKYTDPYKVTRRLIVQAAAQIGRKMP